MRALRHDHLIAYQERLRVHHIEESDRETIEARELVHMAEDSDDKDEAQALPMAGGPSASDAAAKTLHSEPLFSLFRTSTTHISLSLFGDGGVRAGVRAAPGPTSAAFPE